MVDRAPEFETADKKGSSVAISGTVGTLWTALPSVAGGDIQAFTIVNDVDNTITEYLEISLDGGVTVMDKLWPSGHLAELIKGSKKQIHIRGQSATVAYRATIHSEDV